MWSKPPTNKRIGSNKQPLAQKLASGRPPMIPTVPSDASAGSAPTSVMCLPSSPLTRDLSDLSGSYMNGNTSPRRHAYRNSNSSGHRVPTSIGNGSTSEASSVKGPWRQAHVLSSVAAPPPPPPPPPAITADSGNSSVGNSSQQWHSSSTPSALIVVERNGVVELVKGSTEHEEEDGSSQDETLVTEHVTESAPDSNNKKKRGMVGSMKLRTKHPTTSRSESPSAIPSPLGMELNMGGGNDAADDARFSPVIILLMDPGRKLYEMMQLWVDVEEDTVRDVLHAVQHKLSDKWRQDYDGLFQIRSPTHKQQPTTTTKDSFCQLVHILPISKYDVQPRELWVAKPWSMAAKATIEYANDCIRQLRAAGLLSYAGSSNAPAGAHLPRIRNLLGKSTSTSLPETASPLTLSAEAMKRLYVPDGVMKHHHACQFLSFTVPGAASITNIEQIVANTYHHHPQNSNRLIGTSLLGTASFDDTTSQLSSPSGVFLLPHPFRSTSSSLSLSNTTYTTQQHSYFPHLPQHEEEHDLELTENDDFPDKVGDGQTQPATSDAKDGIETNGNKSSTSPKQALNGACGKPQSHVNFDTTKYKEKRSLLVKLLHAISCQKRRNAMSVGKEDGYSSSSNGKCSSRSSKNHQNNQFNADNQSGRSTPDSTSKGSAGVEDILDNLRDAETMALEPPSVVNSRRSNINTNGMLWAQNCWNGITPIGEEGSIVSDSAPLLISTLLLK